MITREDAEKKVALINNKLKNEDYEEALILLESIPSEVLENYDKTKLDIIEKLFYKLSNNKKFDEAIRKIDAYKRKYYYFSTDLQKIESQIYFNLAKKENDEKKVDSALSYSEKSVSLDKNNENAKFLIIRILIFDKKFYEKP